MARQFREKQKSEFEQKTLEVRRVTRVMEGGKRFSFRAAIVIGDMAGRVAVAIGKGADVALAIEKAMHRAKKDLLRVPLTAKGSIPHEARAKYGSANVLLKPAAEGRGIIAGGAMRAVCALAGIKNVTGKVLSSSNKLNIARATVDALRQMKQPKKNEAKIPAEKTAQG